MITEALYRSEPYLAETRAQVVAHTSEGGLVTDRTVFYPTGGGQPGDAGWIAWDGGRIPIATAVKGDAGAVVLVPSEAGPMPAVGTEVTQSLDWTRRHLHMRIHTALHLLSVVLPFPVTGGQIGAGRGRLDFAMEGGVEDPDGVEAALNTLIDRDLPVTDDWITDAELETNPGLVKTMAVKPPIGQGRVRLVRIGMADDEVDLQPCGGTHVARTGEIGRVLLAKIENKGRLNRRVNIALDL